MTRSEEHREGKECRSRWSEYDEKKEKVYSDKYIRIQEEDKIITGIGFESNQDMTKYKIFDSQGEIPINESVASDSTQKTVSADSVLVAVNPAMATVSQKKSAQIERPAPQKLTQVKMDRIK